MVNWFPGRGGAAMEASGTFFTKSPRAAFTGTGESGGKALQLSMSMFLRTAQDGAAAPVLQLWVCYGDKHLTALHRHPGISCNTQRVRHEPRASPGADHTFSSHKPDAGESIRHSAQVAAMSRPGVLPTHTGHPVKLSALLLRDDVIQ